LEYFFLNTVKRFISLLLTTACEFRLSEFPLSDSLRGSGFPCVGLFRKSFLFRPVRLHPVDGLCQNTLVFELVTLREHVEGVVDVLINLLGITHLHEETAQDTHAAHPQNLEGETGIGGTPAFTVSRVSSLSFGGVPERDASPRVYHFRLLNDQTVAVKPCNITATVGEANFVHLIGVKPYFPLATSEDGRCETLLESERNWREEEKGSGSVRRGWRAQKDVFTEASRNFDGTRHNRIHLFPIVPHQS